MCYLHATSFADVTLSKLMVQGVKKFLQHLLASFVREWIVKG